MTKKELLRRKAEKRQEEDEEEVKAISVASFNEWGCPYCGHNFGEFVKAQGGTTVFHCKNVSCNRCYILLAKGKTMSTISVKDPGVYPRLQKHPRE